MRRFHANFTFRNRAFLQNNILHSSAIECMKMYGNKTSLMCWQQVQLMRLRFDRRATSVHRTRVARRSNNSLVAIVTTAQNDRRMRHRHHLCSTRSMLLTLLLLSLLLKLLILEFQFWQFVDASRSCNIRGRRGAVFSVNGIKLIHHHPHCSKRHQNTLI